ncbi:hypothetical protein E2562_038661 [Oryza meyeriana var. granulata]|uniref:Uncharacterized protein n=1 Tax=Oryza meyeriana var. granulata TaxID=110450 RepID=A0A6G1FGM6_9ORYZ|nr:hypothetical protein E2562_038661 [Oryza meyeriana var. granulata]
MTRPISHRTSSLLHGGHAQAQSLQGDGYNVPRQRQLITSPMTVAFRAGANPSTGQLAYHGCHVRREGRRHDRNAL